MADVIVLRPGRAPDPSSTLFRADEPVSDLIPGGEGISTGIVFADDCWNLAGHGAWRDKAGSQTQLNFTKLGRRWITPAKEMILLQLNPDLAAARAGGIPMADSWREIQEAITPSTAQGNLKLLSHGLAIIDRFHIAEFTDADWDRLVLLLIRPADVTDKKIGVVLAPTTGRARAQQLLALWQVTQFAGRTTLLGLGIPFGGAEISSLYQKKGKQNAVRPHESVGHMLGYTAWVFDHIAEDIVSHLEWWATNARTEAPLSSDDLREGMLELVGALAKDNAGVVPGNRNANGGLTLAHSALGRLLGCYDADEAFMAGRWALSQLRGAVTLSETLSPCPLPIALLPRADGTNIAWAQRLMSASTSLDIWQRRLVYCAMFYLSSTVMLRDSQLAVLPMDPLTTATMERPDGSTYVQHTLRAYKTKQRFAVVPTTVVVNGRIAQIIGLLQRMQVALGYRPALSSTSGETYLFDQRLATPLGKTTRSNARDGLYLDLSFVKTLQEGARELHDRGVLAKDLSKATLNMREVRITCAQAYAVREHGQALAAAFGQWDTARVAAGYIGDVYKLITPIEPEETLDLAQQDIGRRLARTVSNRESLTGKGLARLDAVAAASRLSVSNPQPLTPARLKTLGKLNPNIEQGPLTLCIFQPEGALCGGRGKPDFRLCLPGQCRNSVMSRADRARHEVIRRQNLALNSPVLRRAAEKLHEANPDITTEFADTTDDELNSIISANLDDYVQAALESRV